MYRQRVKKKKKINKKQITLLLKQGVLRKFTVYNNDCIFCLFFIASQGCVLNCGAVVASSVLLVRPSLVLVHLSVVLV